MSRIIRPPEALANPADIRDRALAKSRAGAAGFAYAGDATILLPLVARLPEPGDERRRYAFGRLEWRRV